MAKRLPGKKWLSFELYGLKWQARIAPHDHKLLDGGDALAMVYFDDHLMYFSDKNSNEQLRTALVHEIQHVIEEHADVDYGRSIAPHVGEMRTDAVARGWLYLIRTCPEVIRFLRAE